MATEKTGSGSTSILLSGLETDARYADIVISEQHWPEGNIDVITTTDDEFFPMTINNEQVPYRGAIEFDLVALSDQLIDKDEVDDEERLKRIRTYWSILSREDKIALAILRRTYYENVNKRSTSSQRERLKLLAEQSFRESLREGERVNLLLEKNADGKADDAAVLEMVKGAIRRDELAYEALGFASSANQEAIPDFHTPGIEFCEENSVVLTAYQLSEKDRAELAALSQSISKAYLAIHSYRGSRGIGKLRSAKEIAGIDENLSRQYASIVEKNEAAKSILEESKKNLADYETYLFGGDDFIIDARTTVIISQRQVQSLQQKAGTASGAAVASAAATAALKIGRQATGKEQGGFLESAATAATLYSAAQTLQAKLEIAAANNKVNELQTKIETCRYIQRHPSKVLRLKQSIQALENQIAETDNLLDPLRKAQNTMRSIVNKSRIATIALASAAIALAIILFIVVVISLFGNGSTETVEAKTTRSGSASASMSSSSSRSSEQNSTSKAKTDSASSSDERPIIPVGDSSIIETPFYIVTNLDELIADPGYDYINAYSTKGFDDGGIGYITSVYNDTSLLFKVACYGGEARPTGNNAWKEIGTTESEDEGVLTVCIVVPYDSDGPNGDVAYKNASAEMEVYAEGITVEEDVAAGATDEDADADPEASDYVLPESDSRYYTEDELEGLSTLELYYARNEIFARHGRTFNNEDLNEYFGSQPWYHGEYSPEDFDSWFTPNEYEKANAALIGEVERELGSPYLN